MWITVLTAPIIATYAIWRHDFARPDVIFFTIVSIFVVFRNALPLCKVFLTDKHIIISYLLPIPGGGRFAHHEIESYSEMAFPRKGKKITICGILQPRERKSLLITRAGTKDFAELNSTLLGLFPRPQEKPEQESKES